MRITIKKQTRERGLAGVCQEARGWDVRIDSVPVASVRPLYRGPAREIQGWYFYARSDEFAIPLRNTCNTIGWSEEDAKAAALAYVKQYAQASTAR